MNKFLFSVTNLSGPSGLRYVNPTIEPDDALVVNKICDAGGQRDLIVAPGTVQNIDTAPNEAGTMGIVMSLTQRGPGTIVTARDIAVSIPSVPPQGFVFNRDGSDWQAQDALILDITGFQIPPRVETDYVITYAVEGAVPVSIAFTRYLGGIKNQAIVTAPTPTFPPPTMLPDAGRFVLEWRKL